MNPTDYKRTECVAALLEIERWRQSKGLGARPDLRARFVAELDQLNVWPGFRSIEECVDDFLTYEAMLAPINPFLLVIGFGGLPRIDAVKVAITIEVSQTIVHGRCIGAGANVTETVTCAWCGRTDELHLPPYYHELEDNREQDELWWGAIDDVGYQDVRGELVCEPCALEDPQVIAEGRADMALAAWKDGE